MSLYNGRSCDSLKSSRKVPQEFPPKTKKKVVHRHVRNAKPLSVGHCQLQQPTHDILRYLIQQVFKETDTEILFGCRKVNLSQRRVHVTTSDHREEIQIKTENYASDIAQRAKGEAVCA